MMKKRISKLSLLCMSVMLLQPVYASAMTTYDVPADSEFKSFMDYEKITSTTSRQWQLQRMCTTTSNGLRIYNGRYTVAVGTYFDAPVGTYIDVTLSTGKVLKCIVGDIKQDIHTDSMNIQAESGNVVEFIVDENKLSDDVHLSGTISTIDAFGGYVVSIKKYSRDDIAHIEWDTVVDDIESTNSYLVTDKYVLNVDGESMYIVEYSASTDCNTVAVDKETFDKLSINYSVISI